MENITEEEKRKLKITNISKHEINFDLINIKLQFYNYKDGDFSIALEQENEFIEVILNEFQIDIIKKFLNQNLHK
jgi:hypothetical protein